MLNRKEIISKVSRGVRRNKMWTTSISISWLLAFYCLLFRPSLQGTMVLGSSDIEVVRGMPRLSDQATTSSAVTTTELRKRIFDPNGLPFIDLEKIQFAAMPDKVCNNFRQPEIICVVFSDVANYQNRKAIRNGWGGVNIYPPSEFGLFFAIETTRKETDFGVSVLENETTTHGDILYLDYEGRKSNYSYKSAGSHNFIIENCASALYVVQVDDHTIVNLKLLVKKLRSIDASSQTIACNYTNVAELMKPTAKLSNRSNASVMSKKNNYQLNLTKFCSNSGYAVTLPLLDYIYQGYATTQPLPQDNIYVTGILTQNSDVSWTMLNTLTEKGAIAKNMKQNKIEQYSFHLLAGVGFTDFANVSFAMKQQDIF